MNPLRETEIDGVLCFWTDMGQPLSAAQLIFRQGLADEPLHETGWLRLLEHLALLDRETLERPVRGSVDMLLTRFTTYGTPEAITDRLISLARWLEEPDFQLLARERGVLQAEAQLRADPLIRSLTWRFGAIGPGVSSYAEVGALRATPELLAERSRRVFNRSNAVLVLNGEPPSTMALPFPPGEYQPPTPAHPVERPLPATYVDEAGLTLSGLVRRTHASTFLPGILERAVHDGMRERTGGVDGPWAFLVDVDDQHSVVAGGAGVERDILDKAIDSVTEVAHGLANEGVPRAWLKEAIDARLGELEAPDAAFGVAKGAALAVLSDRVPKSMEELVEELRTTDPTRVDAAAQEFHASLLLGAPEHVSRGRDALPPVSFPESEPTGAGPRHRHVDWPGEAATFAADSHTVERVSGQTAQLMRVPDVVSVFAWRDGTRQLIGRDGASLWMEPAEWRQGERLTQRIDDLVPEPLRVAMPDRAETFKPMPPVQLWSRAALRSARTLPGQVVWAVICFLLGARALTGGHWLIGPALVLAGLGLAARVAYVVRQEPLEPVDEEPAATAASP
jgi:hypothetical protein